MFRGLRNVRVGDELELAASHGDFPYRVRQVLIVNPDDVCVLQEWPGVRLTLVTCYPFRHIGRAPQGSSSTPSGCLRQVEPVFITDLGHQFRT